MWNARAGRGMIGLPPEHLETPMAAPIVSVRCPHCGARFAFDPEKETVSTGPAPELPAEERGPATLTYRPECTYCRKRVAVRVRSDDVP